MLNWWLGKGAGGSHGQDANSELDPPDTPAPIFAARALKSAIFGTPAPAVDDTLCETDELFDKMANNAAKTRQSMNISPSKPQGILLTPGTAASRRKTVSFGNEVVDTVGVLAGKPRRSGKPEETANNTAGESSTNEKGSRRALRKPSFASKLENAREGSLAKALSASSSLDAEPRESLNPKINDVGSHARSGTAIQAPKTDPQPLQDFLNPQGVFDGDITTDLNEPHSQSGKYWKSQYQTYHDDANVEMENLLKRKQLIKGFAKTKDEKAMGLAEELKEERQKVIRMQSEISKLSSQIAKSGLDGAEHDTPDLSKELTKQTALALEYKAEAESIRRALQKAESKKTLLPNRNEERLAISRRSEEILPDSQLQSQKALEQFHNMVAARDNLRQTLSIVEGENRNLRGENIKLTVELRRANHRLENYQDNGDRRWQPSCDQYQQEGETLKALREDYNDLKERAKSQRRNTIALLRKKHHQAVAFRKEIASMKGAEATIQALRQDLQEKTLQHDQIVLGLQKQIADLKANSRQERESLDALEFDNKQQSKKSLASQERFQSRHSLISVAAQSTPRPSKKQASRSETPAWSPRSVRPALSEIIDQATVDTVPPKSYSPVQYTPLARRFSDLTLDSPNPQLPVPELSPHRSTRTKVPEISRRLSPRPSMLNITSSPPEPMRNDRGARRSTSNYRSRMSSLDGTKSRNPLTPERAAAARARLERKAAERKRRETLETDKENTLY